jgi:hypothetical protein
LGLICHGDERYSHDSTKRDLDQQRLELGVCRVIGKVAQVELSRPCQHMNNANEKHRGNRAMKNMAI